MISIEYIAGLFDGEGYISFNYTSSGYLKCQVGLSIGCKEVLEAIQQVFPEVEIYEKKGTNHKLYTMFISGTSAKNFVGTMQKHCIVKHEDIAMYFEWLALPKAQPRQMTDIIRDTRKAFHEKFKAMRERQKAQGIVRASSN